MSLDRILAVAWKEWREVARLDDGFRALGLRFILVAVFGVVLSWRLGSEYGRDWSTIGVLVELAILAALPVAPDAFAGERERHTLESLLATAVTPREVFLGKYLAIMGFAAVSVVLGAVLGVATALLRYGSSRIAIDPEVMIGGMILGALGAAVIGGLTMIISIYSPTVRSASQRSAYGLVALLLIVSSLRRTMSPAWRMRLAQLAGTFAQAPRPSQIAVIALVLLAVAAVVSAGGLASFGRRRLS